MKQNQLLRKIQEYAFSVNELTLYLDTHPKDTKALEMLRTLANELSVLEAAYTKEFGPLTAATAGRDGTWNWIEGPWPWENQCEVK